MSRLRLDMEQDNSTQLSSSNEILDTATIEAFMAELESDSGSQEIVPNQENSEKLIMSEKESAKSTHDLLQQQPQEQSKHNNDEILDAPDQILDQSETKKVEIRTNEIKDDDLKLFFKKVSLGQIHLPDKDINDIKDTRFMENTYKDEPNNIKIEFGGQEVVEEIKGEQYGENLDDFFQKVQIDQQLYDEYGNLMTKPKSIFTTLDRFYTRPLSYLKLDIVNSAEYTRQSRALDSALNFLNSRKCKDLLAEGNSL